MFKVVAKAAILLPLLLVVVLVLLWLLGLLILTTSNSTSRQDTTIQYVDNTSYSSNPPSLCESLLAAAPDLFDPQNAITLTD